MNHIPKKAFDSEVTTPQSTSKQNEIIKTRTEEKVRKTSHAEETNESDFLREDAKGGRHKRKTSSTDKRVSRMNDGKNLHMISLEQQIANSLKK